MANPKRPPSREVRRLREELRRLMERWDAVIRRGAELERDLAQGLAQLRESRAAETLREIPVTQAEHPDGAIRTTALEKAGIHTMAEVLGYSRKELVEIPGFGETSAERILDAADRMLEAARQSVRLRLGQDDPATLPVLRTVYRALRERPMAAQAAEQAGELRSRAKVLEQESLPASGFFRWLFASRPQRERAAAAVEDIRALLESETARQLARWEQESAQADAAGESEILREFEEQAAAYYTAVENITGASLPDTAAHGALSDELIEAVESFPLDTSRLRVTLRRYQTFGAKYALCQKRTLIGDEMGLGKTIEAIAVMAHLAARGSGKFLIVCPAGVLINWCREIEKHSSVPVLRLYGDDREELCTRWLSEGGAGVTTYETLQRLPLEGLEHLDLLIADEAHYVKNPEARRTAALRAAFPSLQEGELRLDPTRLTLTSPDGNALAQALEGENIWPEMADSGHVVLILTAQDSEDDLHRLEEALQRHRNLLGTPPILPPPPMPKPVRSLREALFAPVERLPLENCLGRVAAGQLAPYPPGVPVVAPGEVIGEKELAYLREIGYNNSDVPVMCP